MNERLKTGIIGCGKVAGIHAAALTSIQRSAFTAVCDTDETRAKDLAEKYGVKVCWHPKYEHLGLSY